MLASKYKHTGDMGDLQQAILQAEAVVAADNCDRAANLNRLGTLLAEKYERTKAMEDLELAIQWAKGTVAATPTDHPNLVPHFNNLVMVLANMYLRTNSEKRPSTSRSCSRKGGPYRPN